VNYFKITNCKRELTGLMALDNAAFTLYPAQGADEASQSAQATEVVRLSIPVQVDQDGELHECSQSVDRSSHAQSLEAW
jgi:hypothetical protein